jgi:protein-tyrosine phosphatase
MIPDLFWILGPWRGRLAISTRPRGGDWLEDEIRSLRGANVDVLVSLLEEDEQSQLELGEEGRLTEVSGMRFVRFPIPDRGVPASLQGAVELLREINHSLGEGQNVAVHCRQGIGRSGLIAAGTLIAAGVDPELALKSVSSARGLAIPETPEQRLWVERLLADHLVAK